MGLRPLPSLRVWLQSTSLLAVVAGYIALLAFGSSMAEAERLQRHQRLVGQIQAGLRGGTLSLPLPPGFDVEADLLPDGPVEPEPILRPIGDASWLVSRRPLLLPNGAGALLEVRQNITASLRSQRRDQLLLVAAAGGSMLLTSLLLRLVIWRGLLMPLQSLTGDLASLSVDSLGTVSLDPVGQSQELQPIVTAFNQLQSRLAEAWQRERRFVDGVAHELRTPITVISSHAQSLQADASEVIRPVVGLIAAEATRLGDLITVMLDFARGDAGRLSLSISELDAETLVLEAFERLQALAPDRLRLAAPANDAALMIHADAERVQQCLAALVENALKFSDGAVQLALTTSSDAVSLHVRDQGPGIPEAERTQVLERFVRGSTAIGTRGSGIGLATVVLLMQAMQGELLIGDAPGGGADMQLRFTISDCPPAP